MTAWATDVRRTHSPHPNSPGDTWCGRPAKGATFVAGGEKPTCFHCLKRWKRRRGE